MQWKVSRRRRGHSRPSCLGAVRGGPPRAASSGGGRATRPPGPAAAPRALGSTAKGLVSRSPLQRLRPPVLHPSLTSNNPVGFTRLLSRLTASWTPAVSLYLVGPASDTPPALKLPLPAPEIRSAARVTYECQPITNGPGAEEIRWKPRNPALSAQQSRLSRPGVPSPHARRPLGPPALISGRNRPLTVPASTAEIRGGGLGRQAG